MKMKIKTVTFDTKDWRGTALINEDDSVWIVASWWRWRLTSRHRRGRVKLAGRGLHEVHALIVKIAENHIRLG